ncbi:RNA-directed DNA polymerase from mobile element jockey-like [Elysia marginata]|uniref:RNA-directed DNA polymerase from mobile element jockey-like n=1 Tax=Elysia marginata TaxID=1093978 RepID=A0AAV4H6N8_9GAST|nr:RNA-directed DNA polymerase from mobile element jockey-like [Elysia marginata]
MYSAFETIDRHLLLNILKNIIREDEQCIIRYLLNNSELSIKLKGSSKTESFQRIQSFIGKHFKDKLRDDQINDLEPFQGDAGDLNNPITTNEVEKALARLNNNRACGEDGTPGELIKYGSDTLAKVICNILNRVFSEHEDININGGKVITLQKPGKAKGPVTNLRPITLLNTLRKVLPLIVLNRTKHDIKEYLSPSQSGFREGRSTSDIVWSHRWLVSKIYAENIDFFITGIDMSSAFDTIDRHLLLNILKNIIREDEERIMRYLLNNTELSIKLKGSSKTESFPSNIGTPQGDSLSPVLFVVYLEHVLKNIRKIEILYTQNTLELAYADDVDFVSTTDFVNVETIQKELADFRQLRTILNIKYPTIIKNNALYHKTGETPISLTILEARWRLFGHILRQAINTPPNVAMTKYFKTEGSKQQGRSKTLIVTTLRRDLKSHNNDHWPTRLHSIKDLDHLRDIAQNRSDWKHLTTAIYRSAQAETSVDVAADEH